MSTAPRLTIGLPVYNGEKYVAESLEALLGQSFTDFELIISDNASTDSTGDICRGYEKQDSRVRYFRQPRNIGLAPNHNFVAEQAQAALFKWASNDDLYACDLLERCIDALDKHPDVVLAHSWTAKVDGSGAVIEACKYPLNTASLRAPERFRSLLFDSGGDDDYGVIRTEVLRRTAMNESYHHADRTIIAELGLHGRFYQVPDWLYFRREHPGQSGGVSMRRRCVNMDPRRADRLRHPAVRLYGEYVWGYVSAIRRAPLSVADRRECYRHLAQWFASRVRPGAAGQGEPAPVPHPDIRVDSIVAGRRGDFRELAASRTRRDGYEQLSRLQLARPRKRRGPLQARFLDQRRPEAPPGALPGTGRRGPAAWTRRSAPGSPPGRSTTTPKIVPYEHRTSFASPSLRRTCRPRTSPRAEREMLSCSEPGRVDASRALRPDEGPPE